MTRIQSVDVVHTAITDHRILRSPAVRHGEEQPTGSGTLVSFFKGLPGLSPDEAARNQGLALVSAARIMPDIPLRRQFIRQAAPLLAEALQSHRDDLPGLEALAYAFEKSGDPPAARSVYQTALTLAPDFEMALTGAAGNAESLGDQPSALEYWQRAARVNPWRASYHFHVAKLLAGSNQWPEARDAAQSALRLEPTNLEFRLVAVLTQLRAGERRRALADAEVFARLPKEGKQYVRDWFEQRTALSTEEKTLLGRLTSGE
jgi:tetratricopeptide (TPR) repeat protein